MGWDVERFPEVNNELICCICTGILDDPVEIACRHVFCRKCLRQWLNTSKRTCPHCRAPVHRREIRPVVPMLKNIIAKQVIYCDNQEKGCNALPTIEDLPNHLLDCLFGEVQCENEGCHESFLRMDASKHEEICPRRMVLCDNGCELYMTLAERESHNCIQTLKNRFTKVTNDLQERITKLEQQVQTLVNSNRGNNTTQGHQGHWSSPNTLSGSFWTESFPRIAVRCVNVERNPSSMPRSRSRSPLSNDRMVAVDEMAEHEVEDHDSLSYHSWTSSSSSDIDVDRPFFTE